METSPLKLKASHDRRLRAGHVWIFSNEVDVAATPLQALEPGQPVRVENAAGKFLGHAYANPNSLICARLVSRDSAHPLDRSLLVHRLKIALSLRERFYSEPFYRLVFSESDGLPGLVVDRYGEHLVVQITTAGMELLRESIIEALHKVLAPSSILLRNDASIRELEGLERYVEVAAGDPPDLVQLREGGCDFTVSTMHGQKTGWFFDQAVNRDWLAQRVSGLKVLDVCSYVGAWAVRALAAGAASATCVDVSQQALDQARENAQRNGLQDKLHCLRGDAFDTLRELKHEGERFDVIVLDPPAFIKRKKDLKQGTLAYRRLNEAAMGLLQRDGLLVSASCSYHMDRDLLLRTVQQAGRHSDRQLQLLHSGQQSPDHPIHPAISETAYLKAYFLRVLPTF